MATGGGRPSRRTQGRSSQPGSVRTHRTESEGSPTASGVARRAGRPFSAGALCPDIDRTARGRQARSVREEAASSVFSGASAAPRTAELARQTPSGPKNGLSIGHLPSWVAPQPRLARKKRVRTAP